MKEIVFVDFDDAGTSRGKGISLSKSGTHTDRVRYDDSQTIHMLHCPGLTSPEITSLQSTASTLSTSIDALQSDNTSKGNDISSLQTLTSSQGSSITTLLNTTASHTSDINALQTTSTNNGSRLTTAENSLTSMQSTINSQASVITSLNTQIAGLIARLEALENPMQAVHVDNS
jgi:chromosome segregation ATPase